MIVFCDIDGVPYRADMSKGVDLSLGFGPGGDNPNAFQIPHAEIKPIQVGSFVGSVAAGSGANCDMVYFCPHGNGTHTECIGHITKEHQSVNNCIKKHFLTAQLITLPVTKRADGDKVINLEALKGLELQNTDAIIVRSMPNARSKKSMHWSANNPPYFEPEVLRVFRDHGFKHLLTDFPSVDREEDEGALVAHHVWWNYPAKPRMDASITELIFVPDKCKDGLYFLNLQFAAVESDASPSRPIISPLRQV